ncbi:hypothetical protein LP420_26085 [Massilia sp. B-10]|nr:hypothetical protein LP420_26085 [Massilia sp. B-10]
MGFQRPDRHRACAGNGARYQGAEAGNDGTRSARQKPSTARGMLQAFALGDVSAPDTDLVARLQTLRERLVERESAVYVGAESLK